LLLADDQIEIAVPIEVQEQAAIRALAQHIEA